MIFLSSAAYSLPLDCGNALMFECCLTLPPPLLFQAQLLITPLAASYGKKIIATSGSRESLQA